MRPPRDMDIIEIELTNACVHKCSNCTRFCGHHRQPFFMDFETFKRAVDSLEGFHGTISLMGGEPTLHPQFWQFAEYLNDRLPPEKRKKENPFIYPQKDMMRGVGIQNIRNMENFETSSGGHKTCVDGAGTFSSMGVSYMNNYEIIQDTLKFTGLNDHSNAMYHQPILISRKELGIDDKTWERLRDNCWINLQWSASVTPKGAFFCEIAGALDLLFDGPGGLPIEPGWWEKDISEFGDQLNWCEMCGMALQTFSRDANEEVDDVSEGMYKRLEEIKSKKAGTKHINVVQIKDGRIAEESRKSAAQYRGDFYSTSYSSRFTATSSAVFPKGFEIYHMDKDDQKGIGAKLYRYISASKEGHYIVVTAGKRVFSADDEALWKQYVINPGTLHLTVDEDGSFIALFHKRAAALRRMGMDQVLACGNIRELAAKWIRQKVVDFDDALHHEAAGACVDKKLRFVTYGAGNNGEVLLKELLAQGAGVVAVVDSDRNKQGSRFCGMKIEPPSFLKDHRGEYDRIVIASTDYYDEIRRQLIESGIDEKIIYDNRKFWT